MKRYLLVVICMVLILSACGAPVVIESKQDDSYILGEIALETVDKYLEGETSSLQAFTKLDLIYEQLEEMDSSDALLIRISVGAVKYEIEIESDSVKEKRNELADRLK